MQTERTLIIFKPDAMNRLLVGKILTRFEAKGLRIAAMNLVMHGANGEQAGDGGVRLVLTAVGEDEDGVAVVDGGRGFGLEPVEGRLERAAVGRRFVVDFE